MSSFFMLFLSCSGAWEGGVKNCRISLKLVRWPYLNFWYILEQSFNSHICEFQKNSMGRFFVVAISLYLNTGIWRFNFANSGDFCDRFGQWGKGHRPWPSVCWPRIKSGPLPSTERGVLQQGKQCFCDHHQGGWWGNEVYLLYMNLCRNLIDWK